ncbi:CPBP family intramembrane glutamic endopeptidase [Bacteroides intestinalis]|uniref:CPBP family intramembrane glutamic endopeptidase n=1 Tax=Bacteroides intestinalis TaxID=329854 RepID=UPI001E472490|nr:type II CAAX endopeptidase family protein [Bacteroides intestinalis]
MESMNEDANTVKEPSKLVTYLVVAAKIIVYILLMLGFTGMLAAVCIKPISFFKISGILEEVVMQSTFLAGSFLAAWTLLKNWDHLPIADLGLSLEGRTKDIFWGTFVALAIYAVGFGILYAMGEVEIAAVHFSAYELLLSWILMLLVALTEEIAFRGFVLGHLLTAGANRFVALFLSSALFSLMHIFNPNFSLIAFLNILLAGILIGSTYIYTRNLWFAIALHLFWNWLQGPILGFEVSGGRLGGTLLSLELSEENIINGGTFGFEGSILCTALMIIAIVITLRSASKRSVCDPCPHSIPEPGHAGE